MLARNGRKIVRLECNEHFLFIRSFPALYVNAYIVSMSVLTNFKCSPQVLMLFSSLELGVQAEDKKK